jgi:hypothetical protein
LLQLDPTNVPLQQLSEKMVAFNNLYKRLTNQSTLLPAVVPDHNFSNSIYTINQSDGLNAMMVALEVFELFRRCIPRIDLIPTVEVFLWPEIYFEHVDVLIKKIVIPSVIDIFSKYNLTSAINFNAVQFHTFEPSTNVGNFMFNASRVDQQHPEFAIQNNLKTQIVDGFQKEYLKKFTKP